MNLREFTCETIVADFLLLKVAVTELNDHHFFFKFTETDKIQKEKCSLIEELQLDAIFKLLTKLEANIRQDYNATIKFRRKDGLSKEYLSLCEDFRKRTGEYNKPLESVCKKVRLEDILDTVKGYFKHIDKNFSKNCSELTGYFSQIRHWYAHGRYFKQVYPRVIPDPDALRIVYHQFDTLIFTRQK